MQRIQCTLSIELLSMNKVHGVIHSKCSACERKFLERKYVDMKQRNWFAKFLPVGQQGIQSLRVV